MGRKSNCPELASHNLGNTSKPLISFYLILLKRFDMFLEVPSWRRSSSDRASCYYSIRQCPEWVAPNFTSTGFGKRTVLHRPIFSYVTIGGYKFSDPTVSKNER